MFKLDINPMKDVYKNSLEFYKNIILTNPVYKNNMYGFDSRISQAESLVNLLNSNFKFDKIVCVETGCSQNINDGIFGLLLAKISDEVGGEFHSVDIDPIKSKMSKELFNHYLPNLLVTSSSEDSVNWLKKTEIVPNILHLDSMDLDISNPLPSCLHGWNEFISIKDKMPSGSIILIDDNYLQGSIVNWILFYDRTGEMASNKDYYIEYPIVGKGAHVYQWCQDISTEWDIIGDHYSVGSNIKVIIQKR